MKRHLAVTLGLVAPLGGQSYLDSAREIDRWLQTQAKVTSDGIRWAAAADLYTGQAGVVLFYLELFAATENFQDLAMARNGAEQLWNMTKDRIEQMDPGLYTGLSGIAFTLEEVYVSTGEVRFRNAAERLLNHIHKVPIPEVTDLIAGKAGIGLALLYGAKCLQRPNDLRLACEYGDRLIGQAQHTDVGWKWFMTEDFPRMMPNFSHGTAGVAYFLAGLFRETGNRRFLDAAQEGAAYLVKIARREEEGFRIFHHEPGGEDLFYLGWCHGTPGTSRLFWRLAELDEKAKWEPFLSAGARSITQHGLPARRSPGFWNNVGVCCGSAGIARYALDLFDSRLTEPKYLVLAQRLTADLLDRGTRDADGLRWTHAEHRTRPESLSTQVGYMQGAAGIGIWLLHLDAFLQQRDRRIRLPDDPRAPF